MQTANEITSSLNNLRYYSDRIAELAKTQFNLDCERADQVGINIEPGSTRFTSLGLIVSACSWISTYCDNIGANLQTAIKQDKLLHIIEEIDSE